MVKWGMAQAAAVVDTDLVIIRDVFGLSIEELAELFHRRGASVREWARRGYRKTCRRALSASPASPGSSTASSSVLEFRRSSARRMRGSVVARFSPRSASMGSTRSTRISVASSAIAKIPQHPLAAVPPGRHLLPGVQTGVARSADTSFSKAKGGRWNPPGEFGALYLNASIAVAASQARHAHAGRAIKLFDLRPERRPQLAIFQVPVADVVDVVSDAALGDLGLPLAYPHAVPREACWPIARDARRLGIAGIASRSNAEATPLRWVGEELALFDSQPLPAPEKVRVAFSEWYPDPIPD